MDPSHHPFQSIEEDSFDRASALSGLRLRIKSKNFTCGRVTAVMSGVTLDLREAALGPDGALLSVQSALSGIDILVPPEWDVICEVDPIMGGVDGDRPSNLAGSSPKQLRITGAVVAGGLSVR